MQFVMCNPNILYCESKIFFSNDNEQDITRFLKRKKYNAYVYYPEESSCSVAHGTQSLRSITHQHLRL